jgi:CubicO group peptidase (beta-lactamase class C family)
MKKILSLLFLCLMLIEVNAQQPDLNKLIADSNITGAQIAWFKNGKTVYQNAGFANTQKQIKVDENTMFQAASLSKVVLAYVCLQLVDQKKIDLDKPLSSYFEYARISEDPEAKKITTRIALHHLTGLPNWAEGPRKPTWETSKLKTSFTPGSKWQYSGEGFFFVQAAIEHILNKDFEEIAKEMVFKKLGMKNSSFIWDEKLNDQAAYGHNTNGEQSARSKFTRSNSAFTLLTTAHDYMLFLKELSKKQLKNLMSDTVPLYSKDKPFELAKNIDWGLGIGIFKNELGSNAWHWGDNGSFKGFFMIVPKTKEILICFTNNSGGLKLMPILCEQYFGKASWFTPPNWLE